MLIDIFIRSFVEPWWKLCPNHDRFLNLDIEQLSNWKFIGCKSTVFNSSDCDSNDFNSTHCNSNVSIACRISLVLMQQVIYRCYGDFKLLSILLLFEENQELVAPLDSRWGASSIHNYKRPNFASNITATESTSVIFNSNISKWIQQPSAW